MKIVKTIQQLYLSEYNYYELLSKKVTELINSNKDARWHYESRIKGLESFATKIETGRFSKENIFEDFFACTLVVKNMQEINIAKKLVERFFIIQSSRPSNPNFTHKESYSFPFDDLRLYVKLKDMETGDLAPQIYNYVFEIQIKTFLQHAWTIATHDLIYKSEMIDWGKERVAYQIKAILENAEMTISGVDELSKLDEISKKNKEVKNINSVIKLLRTHWNDEDLPSDRRRLALNVSNLINVIGLDVTQLNDILIKEKCLNRGPLTRNLSPYLIIVQSIINQDEIAVQRYLESYTGKFKILITEDIETGSLDLKDDNNIIRV